MDPDDLEDPSAADPTKDGSTEEISAAVESFGDVTEVNVKGPGGTGLQVKGRGSLNAFRLLAPALFLLVGLVLGGGIVAAGRPFWQAVAVFIVSVIIAVAIRYQRPPAP